MLKNKFFKHVFGLLLVAGLTNVAFTSCDLADLVNDDYKVGDTDGTAVPNPELSGTNINIPNPTFSLESGNVVRMDMSGILHPIIKDWLELESKSTSPSLRAGKIDLSAYIYIEVDSKPKGLAVISNSEGNGTNREADLVFLVDNSGSMSAEADGVAESIIDFANYLSGQKIDIKFGCVGYTSGVNGALNFTDVTSISNYLKRSTGTSRTRGFDGADATTLQIAAQNYQHGRDECGSEAFRYADEKFSFRNSASIVYVNFTDEANQPGEYAAEWGVGWTADPSKWKQQRGTIHTVFSEDTMNISRYGERPWLMSEYTGGTTLLTDPNFTTVISGGAKVSSSMRAATSKYISLLDLPVTGAMIHSYIVRFKNTSTVPDGQHEVKITIQSADKSVQGEKVFKNVSFNN